MLTILLAASIWIACSRHTGAHELYDQLKDSSLADINRMGDSCLNAGTPSQAITFYTLLTSRYDNDSRRHKENTEDYIRAYNNLGYTYYIHYSDYPKAYNNFLRALEVAESNGYPRISPLYQNIGNIYFSLGDTLSAISYSKKAFRMAERDGNHYVGITALSDILSLAGLSNNTDSLADLFKEFDPSRIPDSVPMKEFAVLGKKAAGHILRHEINSLIPLLKEMANVVNTPLEPERHKANAIALLAKAYRSERDLENERVQLLALDSLGKTYGMNDVRIPALRALESNMRERGLTGRAMDYRQAAVNLEDSLLNKHKVKVIMEMESLHKSEKLNEQIRLIDTERRFQTIIIIILSVAIAVVAALAIWIVWRYRVQARYTKALYEKNVELARLEKPEPVPTETLPDPDRTELSGKIAEVMTNDKRIFSQDFTVDSLAEIIGEKKYLVSQTINDCFSMNFNNYLADYRIKEACRRLTDRENCGHLTIEAISEDLGFKSRSNFTTQFKRITGLTPTEFIKMAKSS